MNILAVILPNCFDIMYSIEMNSFCAYPEKRQSIIFVCFAMWTSSSDLYLKYQDSLDQCLMPNAQNPGIDPVLIGIGTNAVILIGIYRHRVKI